ncbi:Elongation factor P [Novosphingobium lubricantis]|jgi:hypothetical protein
MKLSPITLAATAIAMASWAAPSLAVPGGKLATLQQGPWTCEVPGDALAIPVARPDLGYTVVPDSSYVAPDGTRGTYLLLDDRLTLTSGSFAGRRFILDGKALMREVDRQDNPVGMRCVHAGPVLIANPG